MFLWEIERRLKTFTIKGDGYILWDVLIFFLMSVALTWPVVLHISDAALGSQHADGMKHLWTLWWMRASIWDYGQFPFHTDLINYPTGMDLYPIEPLNGIVANILPFVGIITLSNILVLINMTLTGVCGSWFGRVLSGNRWGGLTSGCLLIGSSVMAFFVHVGVGELHHLWWLPLGLGALVKARKTLEWFWFFVVAGCLVLAMISCFYLGFFLAMATLLWSIFTFWEGKETPKLILQYCVAASIAIAIVLPITKSFSTSYKSGDVPQVGLMNYITKNYGQPVTDPPSARLETTHLYTPKRKAQSREESAYGGGRYLGFLPMMIAIAGIIRRPKEGLPWLGVALVGILFAYGTYYTVDGEIVTQNGVRLVMPIFWLNRALGYIAEPLNFPIRFLAMTAVALAGMASLAIRDHKWFLVVPLAVVEIGWGQMLERPWKTLTPRNASALSVMQDMDDLAAVDLALIVRSDMENRFNALSSQIMHGKKLNVVPVERIEYFARDGYFFANALTLFKDLKPIYENKNNSLTGDYRKDFALLEEAGFGWIVVGYRNGREKMPQGIVTELNKICGNPVAFGAGMGAWRLPTVEYTEEEILVWKEEHQRAIEIYSRTSPGMGRPLK